MNSLLMSSKSCRIVTCLVNNGMWERIYLWLLDVVLEIVN